MKPQVKHSLIKYYIMQSLVILDNRNIYLKTTPKIITLLKMNK